MITRAMRPAFTVVLIGLVCPGGLCAADAHARLRVLLLSGQNNHDWQKTTPEIKALLEESGRFVVDVTDHPEQVTAGTLADYEVVVSNWNSFHRGDPPPVVDWPEPTRQAFLDFVRGGRGFVMIHAGGSSFYDTWPEYHELVIARYGFNMTAHGVRHAFPVRVDDADHPITLGLGPFVLHDELWHNAWVVPGAHVLASAFSAKDTGGSGEHEPVLFVRPLGQGRCFATLLGHDVPTIRQPMFRALLCRGTEWAATGTVTLPLPPDRPTTPVAVAALDASPDQLLETLRTYRFGDDRAPLEMLVALVSSASEDAQRRSALADQIAKTLSGEASVGCKRFLCQQLARIGSVEHVSIVAPLLKDPHLTLAARGALEAIPGPEASTALREALSATEGAIRVGVIHSLARRRDIRAVPLITPLLRRDDQDTRAAAIAALGNIGGAEARQALLAARSDLPRELTGVWADALLQCAARSLADGEHRAAAPLYEAVLACELQRGLRVAAHAGYLACQDEMGGDRLWSALLGEDLAMQAAAMRALREHGNARQLQGLATRLDRLPNDLQTQAIALLAAKRVSDALPAIVIAAGHANADVRAEALSALGILGDESTIEVLLDGLNDASRTEKTIIANSLTRLNGAGVNARMIALAKTAPPDHARELVRALVTRKATEAVPTLLDLAWRDDQSVADDAVRAVGQLADPSVCDDLIEILRDSQRTASADAVRTALVEVARRLPDAPTQPVLSALVTADEALAAELMPVLSTLGGPDALRAVRDRTAAPNPDLRLAAVRALSTWCNPNALEPLIEVARTTTSPRERTLALRGFARLLPEAAHFPQERRCNLLEQAIRCAEQPDEKRALLSCASVAPSADVLRWALECLDEPELVGEAALVVVALAGPLAETHPEQVQSAVRRVLAVSADAEVRSRAFRQLCQLADLVNLARHAKADSPDGLEPDFGGQDAPAAIDGDLETYWDEQDNQPEYRLRLTFDRPTTVAAIAINGYRHHYHVPRGFAVLCDDREVARVQDATYADNYLALMLPETTCTTLALVITDCFNESPAIREFEVYGPYGDDDRIQLAWDRSDSTLTLLNRGHPVWTFNYGPELAKPFFHPVALLDGTVLTWQAPPDHPWHHGLWFSWKYINSVNYWEEDPQTGRSAGLTCIDEVEIETAADHTARIEMMLHYAPADEAAVLTEHRVIKASAPTESGHYCLDWAATFTAGNEQVVLDRTPLPDEPGGKVFGGYAGLAFRFTPEFHDPQAVSSDGDVLEWKDDRHRSKAAAMEYHGTIEGRPVGVAILDHPDNLNASSPWYLIRSSVMTYFNPAVVCYGPHTLAPGESFTLRYRVIVHPGQWGVEELRSETARFTEQPNE